jgi:hypothetical protein
MISVGAHAGLDALPHVLSGVEHRRDDARINVDRRSDANLGGDGSVEFRRQNMGRQVRSRIFSIACALTGNFSRLKSA